MAGDHELKIRSIGDLSAELTVPGDKSISHRAAIIAGLSNGPCHIRNYLPSEDCLNTLRAMESLGVNCDYLSSNDHGPTELMIHGKGLRLIPPDQPIDCGNSGTGMRLLAGVLAGQAFKSTLTGDVSLSSRPMGRIIRPLESMGARIDGNDGCAPLLFHGGSLEPVHYDMSMASAQVKSAILLAALYAPGETTVAQPAPSRDHTERMLAQFQVHSSCAGNEITICGGQVPQAIDIDVPGDISSAAFWIVAAAAMQNSNLLIQDVGLNPSRTALLDVLRRMGATIRTSERSPVEAGEPVGTLTLKGGELHGTEIRKEEIPNLIDEIPVLAVAGALSDGEMIIRNASELRVKESDRIRSVVHNLRAMGAAVTEHDDGMCVAGGTRLRGATLDCFGDHRIAMAFAVAGLFADGETVICNTQCIATSYPGFKKHLDLLRGRNT